MVARSLFLSVLLAVTVVQGTRRSSNDVATENLKALEEYKNSMKEQNGQDAKVAAAMDDVYSNAVKLMREANGRPAASKCAMVIRQSAAQFPLEGKVLA
ncbi:hypothetical protein AK812_SmicGene34807 [Symbiodinium microadriaticum]|uniref:Uncharacterized protein n=1 Tax=Symbiodinium microadriaticum TaxID=2951 RepID=A0A1Q9CN32_SYMMI|nr:hypothetical protein AK812_SmicGene34807 [Symbiodinium microadriaticum]